MPHFRDAVPGETWGGAMAFHGHVCLSRRHDEYVTPWSRPCDNTPRQPGKLKKACLDIPEPFIHLGWNICFKVEAHKLILGDVEYLKFKNCFINLKRIILRRVPSVNSTAIRLPFRGDKTFGTPTANGQGTVILSVCKNHPKCAAQGKTKRVNGTVPPVESMVLDAMMGIWLLKGLEILKLTGTGHSNSMQAKCDWQTIVSANGSRSNSYTTSPPCQLHCYTTCDQCCKKMGKWRSAKSKCAQKKICCLAGTNSQAYAVDVDGKDSSHCLQ